MLLLVVGACVVLLLVVGACVVLLLVVGAFDVLLVGAGVVVAGLVVTCIVAPNMSHPVGYPMEFAGVIVAHTPFGNPVQHHCCPRFVGMAQGLHPYHVASQDTNSKFEGQLIADMAHAPQTPFASAKPVLQVKTHSGPTVPKFRV